MKSQLELTLTFVEDMLDMKQMKSGVFHLQARDFNPNEVLSLIEAIFRPQANEKGIKLTTEVVEQLHAPYD